MGVRAGRRDSAVEAEPLTDVLVSGSDEPARRPTRTSGRAAGLLVVAAVAALALPAVLAGDESQEGASVDVALREGSVALPRRDIPPTRDRARVRGGLHVEVVNEGSDDLLLLSADLSPGNWQVAVVDDLDADADRATPGRLLRPGWSAVLVLHRSVLCAPGADHGPTPTTLRLEVDVDGRTRVASLDVGPGQRAYGGRLSDVLGSPAQFCTSDGVTAAPGTAADPGQPFLSLWPPGTGVLPIP